MYGKISCVIVGSTISKDILLCGSFPYKPPSTLSWKKRVGLTCKWKRVKRKFKPGKSTLSIDILMDSNVKTVFNVIHKGIGGSTAITLRSIMWFVFPFDWSKERTSSLAFETFCICCVASISGSTLKSFIICS